MPINICLTTPRRIFHAISPQTLPTGCHFQSLLYIVHVNNSDQEQQGLWVLETLEQAKEALGHQDIFK
jgi:hypothetical protein